MELDVKIEDELKENCYLGTFRWKNVDFITLPQIENDFIIKESELIEKSMTSNWKEYLDFRIPDVEFSPSLVDALSYALSIIQQISVLKQLKLLSKTISNLLNGIKNNSKGTTILNIVIIGAAKKTEERISSQSNYFDELYYYILSLLLNATEETSKLETIEKFRLNIVLTGEEVTKNSSFISNSNPKISYNYFAEKTYEFFKSNSFDYPKDNTLVFGLNCGFGAGFKKLTLSWMKDLQLLFRLNYIVGFSVTNDYEDFKGEKLLVSYLHGKIVSETPENKFKSMSVYKSEADDNWACGNYAFYIVNGISKSINIKPEEVIKVLEENNLLKN